MSNNKFYVYQLTNDHGQHYTGHTTDLDRRVAQHRGELPTPWSDGWTAHQKDRNWNLTRFEEYDTREEAIAAEKHRKKRGW